MQLLLKSNADVSMKRETDGATALFAAAQKEHTEVLKLFLALGAMRLFPSLLKLECV